MSTQWQHQQEKGNVFWMRLLVWIALRLGRRICAIILYPITLSFLMSSKTARHHSTNYLRRVLPHVGWSHVWRHFHTFALTTIDRVYFLSGQPQDFDIRLHNELIVKSLHQEGKGALLLVSHVGSFDVMRAPAVKQENIPVHILMDLNHNANAMSLINALDSELAQRIIDTRMPAPELALRLQEHLNQGHMIGIMADRCTPGEKTVDCDFLGAKAAFPASVWALAAVVKAPVILCVGIYRDQQRYDVYFELLTERFSPTRAQRQVAIEKQTQHFASRIEYYVRQAPYNWFNFYDFWNKHAL